MKMVKSLLLGSAAGLVAVAGAQAADLPVKAKAVEYVKICSLYGKGYYYIPGTDNCIKIGGYVRVQMETGATAGGIPDINGGVQGQDNRLTNKYGYRGRGYLTADVRQQSQYGTLRSYLAIAVQNTDNITDAIHTETAFIQFAGFTAGIASSFYDFHSFAPWGYINDRVGSNLGAGGPIVFGYTGQFGSGLSASIGIEDNANRRTAIIDAGALGAGTPAATAFGTAPTADYSAIKIPDIVANLRVDQAWGSAQVMGAMHQVSAAYYNNSAALSGHPQDKWGYAFGGGLQLNVPGGPGDVLILQGNWAKGATGYVSGTQVLFNRQSAGTGAGGSLGYGWASDAVFGAPGTPNLELTDSWGFTGTYQHNWSPALRTSINGGYQEYKYNAVANAALCATTTLAGVTSANCNNNFSVWALGSRTEWTPVPNLNIGLDVVYTKLKTASGGATTANVASSATNNLVTNIADQDVWAIAMRWQRNFWP